MHVAEVGAPVGGDKGRLSAARLWSWQWKKNKQHSPGTVRSCGGKKKRGIEETQARLSCDRGLITDPLQLCGGQMRQEELGKLKEQGLVAVLCAVVTRRVCVRVRASAVVAVLSGSGQGCP